MIFLGRKSSSDAKHLCKCPVLWNILDSLLFLWTQLSPHENLKGLGPVEAPPINIISLKKIKLAIYYTGFWHLTRIYVPEISEIVLYKPKFSQFLNFVVYLEPQHDPLGTPKCPRPVGTPHANLIFHKIGHLSRF